jgi:hypothetical protein
VRPIGAILAGQMITKLTLSAVLIPVIIWLVVGIGRRIDGTAEISSNPGQAG